MNDPNHENMVAYRVAMSLAEEMLSSHIISAREYDKIDRMIAQKYGLSLGNICCRKPLQIKGFNANMTRPEGGIIDGL